MLTKGVKTGCFTLTNAQDMRSQTLNFVQFSYFHTMFQAHELQEFLICRHMNIPQMSTVPQMQIYKVLKEDLQKNLLNALF